MPTKNKPQEQDKQQDMQEVQRTNVPALRSGLSDVSEFFPFEAEQIDSMLEAIRHACTVVKPDISTKAGREKIASNAAEVSRRKVAFVKEIESAIEHTKKEVKRVDAERIRFTKEADELRIEIRKPLTEWEEKEKARIAGHEQAIAEIKKLGAITGPMPAGLTQEEIAKARTQLEALYSGRQWQEFAQRAEESAQEASDALKQKLADRTKYDAEQAELVRFREAEAARLRKEEEEQAALAQMEAGDSSGEFGEEDPQQEPEPEEPEIAAPAPSVGVAKPVPPASPQRSGPLPAAPAQDPARKAEADRKAAICNAALDALVKNGVIRAEGVKAIRAIVAGKVPNVKISF